MKKKLDRCEINEEYFHANPSYYLKFEVRITKVLQRASTATIIYTKKLGVFCSNLYANYRWDVLHVSTFLKNGILNSS